MRRSAGKNPYPGVSVNVDRHGKRRWRLRKKGLKPLYLPGEYGSVEFRAAYERALSNPETVAGASERNAPGTFDWLIEQYRRSPAWHKMAPISHRNLLNELDRFSRDHGTRAVAGLRPEHVEALLAKKAQTPSAANQLLKLIKRLCRFAIKRGLIARDPTFGVTRYKENPDGFHTWTDAEIAQFEHHNGANPKAILALRLGLCTGAARRDMATLGWKNVSNGRIAYRRGKTEGDVDLPIIDDLREVLDLVPKDRSWFLTHGQDRPYKPETLGNWFRDQCVAAGLPHCSLHGLRKAGATRLANAGATEFEIMAFLGHRSPVEAKTYTKKANRKTLADSGMEKFLRARSGRTMSNL